jgi:hypothetical protein
LGLKLKAGADIQWDELDLRKVPGREEQLQRVQGWGKVRNIKVADSNA